MCTFSKMRCIECGKIIINIKKFIFHVEYMHGMKNCYNCPVLKCRRLFHRKAAFSQHLHSKHCNMFTPVENTYRTTVASPNCTNNIDFSIDHVSHMSDKQENTTQHSSPIQSLLSQFLISLNHSVEYFIAQLYANVTLTKTVIQQIISNVIGFFNSNYLTIIKDGLDIITNDVKDKHILEELHSMLKSLSTCFDTLNTEYKRKKFFEKSKFYNKPSEIKVGSSPDRCHKKNSVTLVLKDRYATLVSLKQTLKTFLESPGNFTCITKYQNQIMDSDDSILLNICNGSVWKNLHKTYCNKLVLPVLLYFDDFETANPLGSHAGVYKLGAVYCSILSIPPEYNSRLENIFLTLLFHSLDRIKFGSQAIFNYIISELKELHQNGINITVNGETVTVYFQLVVITGDNLGVHSICGLVESFNAQYFCRFCTSTKIETTTQVCEINAKLRLKHEYDDHAQKKIFGIKETCIWHEIPNFNIYENVTCDVMHDLFEGVHRYDMAQIISKLISDKYFTLETLNSRIQYFKYDSCDKNIPPPIKIDHINNGYIVMSAAEMSTLVKNFRFIVGDLVPRGNDVWSFYLIIFEITDILISTTISKSCVKLLATLIEEHNAMYISLFKQNLKPKFHFLVHYPSLILKIGPPVLISSMRYEAKHQELKNSAGITKCKKKTFLLR